MKNEKRGLVASLRGNPVMGVLGAALVVVVVLMGLSFYLVQQNTAKDQGYLQLTAELRALSFQVTSLAREATAGNEEAFPCPRYALFQSCPGNETHGAG